jgi:hypothetical protein
VLSLAPDYKYLLRSEPLLGLGNTAPKNPALVEAAAAPFIIVSWLNARSKETL